MISVSISVDVPNLEDAILFYARAFGFSKSSTPVPGVAVLQAGTIGSSGRGRHHFRIAFLTQEPHG